IDAELESEPDNLRFGEIEKRRPDVYGSRSLYGATCREVCHALVRRNVLGTAVRVSGVVYRVHPDEDLRGAEHLGPGEGIREKDRVAGGDVGDGNPNAHLIGRAILWYFLVTREGGA